MPNPHEPTITYRDDLGILTVRWPGDSEAGQVRADYELVLTTLLSHYGGKALLDIRRRDHTDPAVALWFNREWLPRAVSQVAPARLVIAYLVSPTRAAQMQTDPVMSDSLNPGPASATPNPVRYSALQRRRRSRALAAAPLAWATAPAAPSAR